MTKRYRTPKAKEGELLVKYGKLGGALDLYYYWQDEDEPQKAKATVNCLMTAFESTKVLDGDSLRKILEDRGYDITTLKFSIMKKGSK